MFQFAGLPPAPYVFRYGYRRISSGEFPHSEIPGSQNGQHLPRAFRSRPRPSSALGAKASTVCPCSLDQKEHLCCQLWSFQGAHGRRPPYTRKPSRGTVSQNSTAYVAIEVDIVSRRAGCPGRDRHAEPEIEVWHGNCNPSTGPTPAGVRAPAFPRKEVIQPQLPLRLPCYDFTPITDPTFDGSLPCGLGHRLRVLPTFVV